MKNVYKTILILMFSACILPISAQDTFSIVAVDTLTGEVGSAGASCVDLLDFPSYTTHFLGELLPGLGAVNTQAYYNITNQINARNRMLEGSTPLETIEWLEANDSQNNPSIRQYGIVGFVDGKAEAAGYTGINTDDYKNHITGPNYSIQGNILLGQEVLDQMEDQFLNSEGDLACKLMAALQGAKIIGADTRCFSNGTSSLFAFVKVAQPDDLFGNPSFVLGLKTASGAQIEPIDSLQVLFDQVHLCSGIGMEDIDLGLSNFSISPNPAQKLITLKSDFNSVFSVHIFDEIGKPRIETFILNELKIDVSSLEKGIYFIRFSNDKYAYTQKLIKL
jgi:uncharacterized Ntn-hydrolase superfamily protein